MKQFLLLILIIPHIIFAEDIFFKVIETTPAWEDINFPKPGNISGEIPEGSIVKGDMGVQFSDLEGVYENIPFQQIVYDNKRMLVYADSIIPLETKDLFNKNLLYNSKKVLISSLFLNAFHSDNREIIYLRNRTAWDEYIARIEDEYGDDSYSRKNDTWWSYFGSPDKMIITQTALTFGSNVKNDSHLLIKSIIENEEGFIVKVKESTAFQQINKWWNWPDPKENELFTILLIPDGDYIDLYLNNKNNLIDTFVFVNKEFLTQIDNLMHNNPVDVTRVSWPRRADGSMDYPPPIDMTHYTATHRTLDNLRLRDAANTSSKLVTTLPKDTEVQIIETGSNTTIDGVSAPWVKVISSTGYTGWCFSGYLEEIKKSEPDSTSAIETPNQIDPNLYNTETNSMPLWLWIIIAGGAIVIAGGVVFILKRKK